MQPGEEGTGWIHVVGSGTLQGEGRGFLHGHPLDNILSRSVWIDLLTSAPLLPTDMGSFEEGEKHRQNNVWIVTLSIL